MICVIYSNCQGDGVAHFLKRTKAAKDWDIRIWHNWQILMGEQDPKGLMADVAKADCFIYQPAARMGEAPSTEEIVNHHLPETCARCSFSYVYNHGFFPLVQLGEGLRGWATSEQLRELVVSGDWQKLFLAYNGGAINYDCARRFLECLAEQSKREEGIDVCLVDFILREYREQQLFLSENHPTSALLVETTRRIMALLGFEPEGLSWQGLNDAGMCHAMPIHPAVCLELGLKFAPSEDAMGYYRHSLEKLFAMRPSKGAFQR